METNPTLTDLRKSQAETRIKLREAQDRLKVAQAQAERRVVDAAGDEKALGPNEAARSRAFTVALADDTEYQAALATVRGLEAGLDRLDAQIESIRDARRQQEWQIRERLIDALDGRGIANDNGQVASEFDAVANQTLFDQLTATDGQEPANGHSTVALAYFESQELPF